MKSSQGAKQVKVDELTKRVQRLLNKESLVGAEIILKSVRAEVAQRIIEQLSPAEQEKIRGASFIWKDENLAVPHPVTREQPALIEEGKREKSVPLFPDQLLSALTTAALMTSLILILTIFSPAKLDVKADVLNISARVKPEWYLLFLYAFFNLVPSILGVLVPMVGVVLLALLPFLDRNPELKAGKRKFAIIACSALVLVLILLSILGAYA